MRRTKRLILWLGAVFIVLHAIQAADTPVATIRFVYLGSSGCKPCKQQEYKDRIAAIRAAAQQWAKEYNYAFKTRGVALDDDKARGDRFLSEVGTYDEIVTGKGWDAIRPYVDPYKDKNPMARDGIPQLVILLETGSSATPRELYRAAGNLILFGDESIVRASLKAGTGKH